MSLGVPRAKGEAKAAWDISGLLVGNPPRTHGLAQHYPSFALHSPLLSQLSRVHVCVPGLSTRLKTSSALQALSQFLNG